MIEPSIIYKDENLIAVDKPAGLLVHESRIMNHGSKGFKKNYSRFKIHDSGKEPTVVDWLLKRYPEVADVGDDPKTRPGIVHRLDRETSGVLLTARNQKYFEYLKTLFRERRIRKIYLAVVHGVPKEKQGRIEKPIGIKSGTVKRTVHEGKMKKVAVSRYRVLEEFIASGGERYALLEVIPETGRTHQIRVHLASIGHPVLGDRIYGRRHPDASASRLMLHALAVEFPLQEGRRMRIEAAPPGDFVNVIEILKSKTKKTMQYH